MTVRVLSAWMLTPAFAFLFALLSPNSAHATTYNLTLTDSSAPAASGTGVLTIVGTPTTGQYCLGGGCTPGDVLTSLSFTIGSDTFSTSLPNASGVSATFTAGVLTALGFDQTVGNHQLHMPAGGNLQYSFQEYSGPLYYTTGVITFALAADPSATPLPATLPLFAGGLGIVGLLTRRRKGKSVSA